MGWAFNTTEAIERLRSIAMDKLHHYNELRKRYDHIQDRFIDLFRDMLAEIEAKDEEIATLKSSIEPACSTDGLLPSDVADNDLESGIWYRSASSGLYYRNRNAAGALQSVRVDGQIFVPLVR